MAITEDEARKNHFPLIEQLRYALASAWSRRIDEEHRLVYLFERDDIVILQARYHYG